jgi:hypothetical protein
VRGWAIAVEGPRIVAVEGLHDGQRVFHAPLDVERPRTAAEHRRPPDEPIGFHAPVGSLRLAPQFELEVRALPERGGPLALGTIAGRRASLRSTFAPRREPVAVTTHGRTGSMLLMRLLAAHPEVMVYRPHRFEQRIASYWGDVLLSLAEPSSYIRQVAPPPDVDDPAWWLGGGAPAPWALRDAAVQEWLGGDALESLAPAFQQRIEATYDRIAATTDTGDAPRFAEKFNLRAAALIRELYPGSRELFLVRDFRDMVCSILSFNRKRGVQGFGRAAAESDAAYIDSLGGWATALVRAWERRRETAQLVRYEDLVSDPEPTLARALAHVGVDASPGTVAEMLAATGEDLPELHDHRTSEGPAASIGRWRRELDPGLLAECERAMGPALEAFAYE